LDIYDDTERDPRARTAGPESLFPTKRFAPTFQDKKRSYFVRPELDPVFEKMVFGLNAYGNVDMGSSENIRALLGIQDEKFDLVFAKNSYRRVEPAALADLLSDNGMYIAGGLWKGPFYHPVTMLAERNGDNVEAPDDLSHEGMDGYLKARGILGKEESVHRANRFQRRRAAKEFISRVKEGVVEGVRRAQD
jgi:hypothetical protein